MGPAERTIARISRALSRVGGFSLLASALLISVEVVGRSSHWLVISLGTELSTYLFAIAATWSLAYVVFERAHVRVDVIAQRLPPGPRTVLDLLALASLAAVGLVLSLGGLEMVATSLRLGSRSNTTLGMPLALPHAAWTFGLVWFTAVSTFRLAQAARAALSRDFAEAARVAASPSADDEVEDAIAETQHRLLAQD